MSNTETEHYGLDEDAEYLSVFWGILRVPVVCAGCGTRTRSPCHTEGGRRLCGSCYRAEMWPPESRAEGAPDPPPSAPGGELAAARPSAAKRGRGKERRKAAAAPGRAGGGRRCRGVTGGTDNH